MRVLARDFTFDEYLKLRRGGLKSTRQEFSGISLIWIAVLGKSLAFSMYELAIPILGG